MEPEEVIEQLESLRFYCEDMRSKEDPGDIYLKDSMALTIAIKIIKKDLQGAQSHQANKK